MIAHKISKVAVVALSFGILSLCFTATVADAKSAKKANGADKTSSARKASTSGKSTQDKEGTLSSQVAQITQALAARDAKKLSALWTEDGTYVDDDGNSYKGRAAIQDRFAAAFQESMRPAPELVPEAQRFLSDTVALSEGIVRVKGGAAQAAAETRYSIVFLKQNGAWMIFSATETPVTTEANVNPLDDLSWIVGEWSAQHNGGTVHMKADWAGEKNFITCTYETKKTPDSKQLVSRQIIGWDPQNEQPISWYFDSSGGFGSGHWVKNGKRWEIEAVGMERDGRSSLATNIIEPEDRNSFLWQSLNRSVDGVAFTDTAPLKIQRAAN